MSLVKAPKNILKNTQYSYMHKYNNLCKYKHNNKYNNLEPLFWPNFGTEILYISKLF